MEIVTEKIETPASAPGFKKILLSKVVQFFLGAGVCYWGILKTANYPQNWILGLTCLVIAPLLMFYSFPRKIEPMVMNGGGEDPSVIDLTSAQPSQLYFWIGTFALMFGSIASFRSRDVLTGSILAVGLAAYVIWVRVRKGFKGSLVAEFPFSEKKWFLIVMAVAAALRFAFVGTNLTGLQGDEANNLMDTLGVYSKGPFSTGWGGTPTFPYFLLVLFFKIFGVKLWVARFSSSVVSLVALWFFYRWSRFWLSPLASVIATFWLGVSWWYFYFSLSPFHNTILFMTMIGAFYFMESGFRSGKRSDFWWSGVLAAACIMNYVSGRSVPVMMFLTILFYVLFRGLTFLKTYWKGLLLSVIGFFWLSTPFLIYAIRNPNEVWGRVQPGWIVQEAQHSGSYFFILKSYGWTLASLWTLIPQVDSRFITLGMAFLDPVTGAFALLGFVLCWMNIRKPIIWVLLPGLFFGLSSSALARLGWPADFAYVQSVRLSIVIPFVFLMAGWGFDWCLSCYRSFRPSGWGWISLLTAIAVIGPSALNEPIFLSRFGNSQSTWGEHGFAQMELSKLMLANAKTHHFIIDSDAYSNAVIFMTRGATPRPMDLYLTRDIPIPYQATKDVMLFFSPWRITEEQRKRLQHYYPNAIWTPYRTPWNEVYLNSVDIALKDVIAAQKGKKLSGPLP